MKIIDTYNDILELLSINPNFDISLWKSYASKISVTLPQKLIDDSKSYDFVNDILPVLKQVAYSKTNLDKAHNSFILATQTLEKCFFEVFQSNIDVDIIFYLGLCNGAGWATTLEGKKVILLGVEKIIELNWYDEKTMISLIYHELGHIWHDTVGKLHYKTNKQSEKAIWQLYQEGFAMFCEQLLCNNFDSYHQDKEGWLFWCKSNKILLFQEYLRRVDNEESTQDFFGDWCNYMGYSNIGYYLGCEYIKWLSKRYPLRQIANMDIDLLFDELHNFVKREFV